MRKRFVSLILVAAVIAAALSPALLEAPRPRTALAAPGRQTDERPTPIPAAAWTRPIGLPFEKPAREKVNYPMIDDGPLQGAPLGGLGAGTFARTYAGDFARWHTDIGTHRYATVAADMFSVYARQRETPIAQALWTGAPRQHLDAWTWEYPVGAGDYYALYPRSWFVYDWERLPVDLSVEQFSPVIPHDYQASSYPVALFTWTARNPTDQPVTVGVMFTWENSIGDPAGRLNTSRAEDTPAGRMVGVEMGHADPFDAQEDQGTAAIAALEVPGVTVSTRSRFVTNSDGADVWTDFADDGALDNVDDATPATPAETLGAAVSVTFDLAPGETLSVPFVYAWDQPVMTFGAPSESWYKRYTAFFGRDGDNAWHIAREGLQNVDQWRQAIIDWQAPILADEARPLWYKTALFNELYYLADGGSAWEHGRVSEPDPGPDYFGRFAYLESFDYYWYNTFDVDFYASFAIMELWPEIEIRLMRDFAASVLVADTEQVIIQSSRQLAQRKQPGAVPHDMGSPYEAPWLRLNGFTWQNVNLWKDLNPKFILRVYRDAMLLDRPDLIDEMWPPAIVALVYLARMDRNGDGIPENAGIPDQTYDTWPATGISAYSGGLWLAALAAMREIAIMQSEEDAAAELDYWLENARNRYEDALWSDEYYRYDETDDGIMADQLAGEWYARISGLSVLPDDRVDRALRTIYDHNVLRYEGGQMGAVNGMYPSGKLVRGEQAEEVWVGTSYMLAAHMLWHGLDEQAWGTAYGLYKHVYETGGLWFRTPEAWNRHGFRASMYMRPLAIWAMETALKHR